MAENRGPQLLGVNIALFVVAACIVVLRCFTRAYISKVFGADDWLMVISLILFLGYIICSNSGVRYGTGQHRSDLTAESYIMAKMFWWLCYIFFGLTMIFAKLSFGWLLLRIASKPAHTYVLYGTSTLVLVAGIIFFFVTLLQCQPISKYWVEDSAGHCIPPRTIIKLAYLYSAVSMLTDFIFALLPAFMIRNLQLSKRIKAIIIILMGLGCLASSAVVVRIAYLETFLDPDFLWATTDIAIWSTVEMGIAISASSFSTLRPLARFLNWRIGLSYHRSATSANNGRGLPPANDAEQQINSTSNRGYNRYESSKDTLYFQEAADNTAVGTTDGKREPIEHGEIWEESKNSENVELRTLERRPSEGTSTGKKSIKEFIT